MFQKPTVDANPSTDVHHFNNQSFLLEHLVKMEKLLPLKMYPFILNTVELQCFEHLSDHENMFETGEVRANKC